MPETFYSTYRLIIVVSKRGYLVSSHKNPEVKKSNYKIPRVVEAYRTSSRDILACIYVNSQIEHIRRYRHVFLGI